MECSPYLIFFYQKEELKAFIQRAIPEKTKTATKYCIKFFKGKIKMNLKYKAKYSNKNVNSTP